MAVNFEDEGIKHIMEILDEALHQDYFVSPKLIKESFGLAEEAANEIFMRLLFSSRNRPREEEEIKRREIPLSFKIYLVDPNEVRAKELQKAFEGVQGVEVLSDSLARALDSHKDVDCLVYPACCDRGDEDIALCLGEEAFQKKMDENRPVSVSNVLGDKYRLIRVFLKSPPIGVYSIRQCMSLSLKTAFEIKVRSVLFFDFCRSSWRVDEANLAKAMRQGYDMDFGGLDQKGGK